MGSADLSHISVSNEGWFVNDSGDLVMVYFVDLRNPSDRQPITSLIKGSESRYAIEYNKRVRISKPTYFRTNEEGLIQDRYEAFADRVIEIALAENLLTTDDAELKRMVNDFRTYLTENLGEVEIQHLIHKFRYRQTDESVFGANGWLFSTSIEPATSDEWQRWWASLPESYDHVSHIYRPRAFAHALGSMIVEQLGPLCGNSMMTHSFSGLEDKQTQYPAQMILHGPVVYVTDLYETLSSVSVSEAYIRSIFTKQLEAKQETSYDDQREYRFWVQANDEPDREIVDLDASPALIDAMSKAHESPSP